MKRLRDFLKRIPEIMTNIEDRQRRNNIQIIGRDKMRQNTGRGQENKTNSGLLFEQIFQKLVLKRFETLY